MLGVPTAAPRVVAGVSTGTTGAVADAVEATVVVGGVVVDRITVEVLVAPVLAAAPPVV